MSLEAIFKAYDIRGLVPNELNLVVAEQIGQALAVFLTTTNSETANRPVVVGHDMRADSKELAAAAVKGLCSQGRPVVDIGLVASDMLYFAVGHLEAAGGIVVTASHNPGAYNGMKLCREEARPIGIETGLVEIKELVARNEFTQRTPAAVVEHNLMAEWIEHALTFAPELAPLKIAVDAGNGMAGAVVPHLAEKTALSITPLYFELDGTFPNHEANPIKDETLADLKQAVTAGGLDLGIAFDGDGDRMVLVDERGETVSGSVTAAILSKHFLQQYPNSTILHNAICSRVVAETITASGGEPVRTKVGHSYIKAAMRKHDAPFGAEHSAHYYFRDNWYADSGLIAAVVAMGVLSTHGGTLSQLADTYRSRYVHSGEINFTVTDAAAVMEQIAAEFSDGNQDWLDGLSVNYDDSWFNVRPSNTEPLLRLNVEGRTQDAVDKLVTRLTALIS